MSTKRAHIGHNLLLLEMPTLSEHNILEKLPRTNFGEIMSSSDPGLRDPDVLRQLQVNIEAVRRRMAAACERGGRAVGDVTLVAVTKYVDAPTASLLLEFGVTELGESRPQELWRKARSLTQAHWHLVGHLQRNKIAATLPLVTLIHSVDSERLLLALNETAGNQQRCVSILLEVNISGETAKQGFAPDQVPNILRGFPNRFPHIELRGLMTMAPATHDTESTRPVFRQLREYRDRWVCLFPEAGRLPELSMGMTQDFEIAIEEGATIVRVGSALFEGLVHRNSLG
jgi:pyridoxal phosphate enzyme (YggS family)